MSAPTIERRAETFRCQGTHARGPVNFTGTAGEARAAGWRVFDGTTMGGADLHARYCPKCIGPTEAEADGAERGYDAECSTCDATMSDEWADDKPDGGWTEDDAGTWCMDHRCEPATGVIPPKKDGKR
jgi:hypothetical protein